ncbi:hypothetical protein CK500_12755 [Halorubrum salipaludis]|uniref:DUF8060 domain-containing protein n=1 Tax=Halorubrum salipaludis TaxID=2032630 RepID=A0A2A2FDS2_9EURY|nr:hypothetical protein [Halorubrum salipaludis]PAU82990.1 hypothetical protein CK500_12755 [Halorubrum salipaludis]
MTDDRDRVDSDGDPDDTTDTPPGPMTDTTTDETATADREPRTTDAGSDATGDADGGGWFDPISAGDLRGLIDRIGLAALILLALIAGWSFYSQAGRAIRTWLDPAYQPIALAAFNLAVLLVALAGVAHQLYRIRRSEGGGGKAAE